MALFGVWPRNSQCLFYQSATVALKISRVICSNIRGIKSCSTSCTFCSAGKFSKNEKLFSKLFSSSVIFKTIKTIDPSGFKTAVVIRESSVFSKAIRKVLLKNYPNGNLKGIFKGNSKVKSKCNLER
mgnify:CR=1 FL=1